MEQKTDEAGWKKVFKDLGVLWVHNRDSQAPHVEMTAGGHSDGFFNWRAVLERPSAAECAVRALYGKTVEHDFFPDIVMGPQTGATYIAQQLAAQYYNCAWSSPRKTTVHGLASKSFIFGESTGMYPDGKLILPVEDTITTGISVESSISACIRAGGTVMPYVLCIMNRSGLTHIGERKIIALLTIPMHNWTEAECPLCKAGSVAIRPKDRWAELVAGKLSA